MVLRHYPQVPTSAVLEIGGYYLVKPGEWQAYLNSLIQIEYPAYYQEQNGKQISSLWRSNACILESLEKYLFREYGVTIPQDNLFKVYNQAGEGVPPEFLLEAIAAVIEPLGFEVDKVIVPDPELRAAVGNDPRILGIEQASLLDGKPGVCMINIKPGESHAFFWERMVAMRFHKEQFRMALIVKPVGSRSTQDLSAPQSVESFCELVRQYLGGYVPGDQAGLAPLIGQVEALGRCIMDQRQENNFRELVFKQVSIVLGLLKDLVRVRPSPSDDEATVLEAGDLVRRIYSETPPLSAG
jgi:hypothetical protein